MHKFFSFYASLVLSVVIASADPLQGQTVDGSEPPNHPPFLVRPIQNLTTWEDVPFKFNLLSTGLVYFGYDVGGDDITITDNYFASHVCFFKPWNRVVFTGNTLVVREHNVVSLKMPEDSQDHYEWDHNKYFNNRATPFVYQGAQSWTAWRDTTMFDQSSRFTPRDPPSAVFVRANQYEPGRGHVIVYNWNRDDVVDIDLSSIVRFGASYKIYNVLNLKGQPVSAGVFQGHKVSVPMTSVPFPLPNCHRPAAALVMDRQFATFLVVSDADPVPTKGNSFFVSPVGSLSGDGSWDSPWDLATALQHPPAVRPGDTIWLRGGTYRGAYVSKLSGTEIAPILVREMPTEEVIIDLFDSSSGIGTLMELGGQHTWYWGFEVFSSDSSPRVTSEAGSWPESVTRGDFHVKGSHLKLINLEIHDLGQGLGFWSAGTGGEANGLIIYNNGWSSVDRNHGHAIYTQNEGAVRRLVDNVAFHQFRNGIMVYGSAKASLKDYHIEGNVSFANGGAVGEGYVGSFQLLIGGGSVAENITVTNNFTYDLPHHFRDDDFGDPLSYSAELVNGHPLPNWLELVGNEGLFHGTPGNDDVGTIAIRLTATDDSGMTADDVFQLAVVNVNDPPQLIAPMDDVYLKEGETWSLDCSGRFKDDDATDTMKWNATLDNDDTLPDWLSFDSSTTRLSSRAVVAGTTPIRIRVTDDDGTQALAEFKLHVESP